MDGDAKSSTFLPSLLLLLLSVLHSISYDPSSFITSTQTIPPPQFPIPSAFYSVWRFNFYLLLCLLVILVKPPCEHYSIILTCFCVNCGCENDWTGLIPLPAIGREEH